MKLEEIVKTVEDAFQNPQYVSKDTVCKEQRRGRCMCKQKSHNE